MNITGSILNSYMVCPRQAWMGAHGISGDKDNDLLREGLYIHEQAYQRSMIRKKPLEIM
ncbi:Dna2/Cas4 domain-containing protein [Cellulosilyticum ruminicola]|uniref:Dna2/Cas4 domain-containing protein n=1 Tax=Cellulosilyticum ruminicola TaxID=425254 RepID=UPI0009F8B69E